MRRRKIFPIISMGLLVLLVFPGYERDSDVTALSAVLRVARHGVFGDGSVAFAALRPSANYPDKTARIEKNRATAARNRPPTIQPIANIRGAEGDPDSTVALVADDPDGDALRYVVHNSAPEIVGATAAGRSLFVDFKKQGIAEVSVTAVDKYGASATAMFKVTVQRRPLVRLQGTVNDGKGRPLARARCRYVTQKSGTELANTTADDAGHFSLTITRGNRGVVECHPPGRRNLPLTAFVSTRGLEGGETLRRQNVTPTTTVVANVIIAENPFNPEIREEQLLADLMPGHPIALLTDVATSLYRALLDRGAITTSFQAAMNDVFRNGALDLAALQPIADNIAQEVKEAEEKHGIGIEASAASLLEINVAPRARNRNLEIEKDRPNTLTLLIEDEVDANGDLLQISAVTQGAHGAVRITQDARRVVYTPNATFDQTDAFTYTLRDATGLEDTATIKVRDTTTQNRPPRLQPIDPIEVVSTAPDRTVTLRATDPDQDADTLDYDISNSDRAVVGVHRQDRTLTLKFKAPGEAIITVKVTDAQGASDQITFTVTVRNRSPRLRPINPIEVVSTAPDRTVTLRATDPDQDADTLDYDISNSDRAVVGVHRQDRTLTLKFKAPGEAIITVKVTDAQGASDQITFTVTVRNRSPRLQPIDPIEVVSTAPDRTVTLRATDPDQDADTLDYDISNSDRAVVGVHRQDRTLTLKFKAPGEAIITVKVTDAQGASDQITFTVTVHLRPTVNTIPAQQHLIGATGIDLPLGAIGCNDCFFRVTGLPPNLRVNRNSNHITGDIAYLAYSYGPEYTVTMRAEDGKTGVASLPASFTWRVWQDEVTHQGDPGSGEAGDGDGDGDSGDGDGGAGGDAGDGGDASPLAGARCVLVNLSGVPFLDETGNIITADTDTAGKFLLRIPHDPNNPDFVTSMEGFIECFHPQKNKLVLSRYFNTKGLRKGERLESLSVSPSTTVIRQIYDGLSTATLRTNSASQPHAVDVPPDLVAIQAQFLNAIAGLQTQSPRADIVDEDDDQDCTGGDPTTTPVVQDINIPLQAPPSSQNGKRAGMTAYIASQLFLAGFKGKDATGGEPLGDDLKCAQDASGDPNAVEFRQVLQRYFTNRTVTSQELLDLGLPKDDGLTTGALSFGCD